MKEDTQYDWLENLIDKHTEALTSTTDILSETADPELGKPGDEIEIVSFDRRLIKDVHTLKQAILSRIGEVEAAARYDELEHIKFIDPKTGEEIFIPFTQFRSTKDGLLLDWEQNLAALQPTNSKGKV